MNQEPARRAQYNFTPVTGVGRIIAIASGKGGVGKSSLTVLLAHALASQGHSVGIVDADIHGPSIPRMLGLAPNPPEVKDGLMIPALSYGIMTNSLGLIAGDQAAIWRGPMVSKALAQLLRGTDWRSKNATPTILLIDLPPGTSDIHLSLMQSVPVNAAILITTPQDVAVADARKAAHLFQKLSIPILGIIENMSYLTTETGTHITPFGSGGGARLAAECGVPLLAQLPLIPALSKALDNGCNPFDSASELTTALSASVGAILQVSLANMRA
jgi:ATP-binding protein involved in chromosome partitioning